MNNTLPKLPWIPFHKLHPRSTLRRGVAAIRLHESEHAVLHAVDEKEVPRLGEATETTDWAGPMI